MAKRTKVLLWSRIARLGKLGDEVLVSPGYARNYLFPKRLASPSTDEARKEFRKQRETLHELAADELSKAEQRGEMISGHSYSFKAQAAENGRLYGAVRPKDVVQSILEVVPESELDRREVIMDNQAIDHTGEHQVVLRLHPDVRIEVTLEVQAI